MEKMRSLRVEGTRQSGRDRSKSNIYALEVALLNCLAAQRAADLELGNALDGVPVHECRAEGTCAIKGLRVAPLRLRKLCCSRRDVVRGGVAVKARVLARVGA
jgi:hypothetical protein